MPKETWYFAAGFTALLVFGLLGFSLRHKSAELALASAQVAAIEADRAKASNELARVQGALGEAQSELARLKATADAAVSAQQSLEAEMRAKLESKDVQISELQGKLTVNIVDRILFDSGAADLKPEGETVLKQVADILAGHPGRLIHVIGHTDNVPIRAAPSARFRDNWELSLGRAIAAVRYLEERAGVDPRRLGAVGYGEHRPLAPNDTAEGRAKNRRIAIVVLPEEWAAPESPEAVPAPAPAPNPTAAPAPEAGPGSN